MRRATPSSPPPLRRTQSRRRVLGLVAVVALASSLLALPTSAAEPGQAPTRPRTSAAASIAPPVAVLLITGETVLVQDLADGRQTAVVSPPPDGRGWAYAKFVDQHGDLHVVPSAAFPLLGERLDPRLFNVSALVRDGYGTASRAQLPLIVTYVIGPVSIPGTTIIQTLRSINGAAITVDAAGAAQLGAALSAAPAGDGLAGIEKIWLDGPMSASLDESVPQIGAPAAWDLGFDGTGVTIGVVDSGIDESHPDVGDRVVAAELFSDAASTTDVLGHGTHVASIAAGSGAASGGQYTGVAYGADLVNAKVLDDFGSGLESWVIAGMEWAAIDQDADIVNMSINGGPTDGTDPVSQAVNTLSADEGALFVTSAGNFGGFPESVETPATADAALAVGAVDKSDVLGWFSAWGPRPGGTLIKPEIVAPGIDITAARATGAEIGEPVGDDYMILSGTSMASPHVAGAAALLLDANPDWGWAELKSALVTTGADIGGTAFQQGGGRVDVEAALAQTVHSDLATVDLGVLEYPHDDGETSTVDVELTNDGDADVSLDLATTAANEDGDPATPEMISVAPDGVDIAPSESVVVTVTFDPATGPIGLFTGALTASVGGLEALHVPLSFEKEPQLVDLTIEVIARDGVNDLFGVVNIQNVDDIDTFFEQREVFTGAQTITARVPLGNYGLSLLSFQNDGFSNSDLVTVIEPEIEVTSDTELIFDSNDTNEVFVDLGEDVTTVGATVAVYRASEIGEFGVDVSFGTGGGDDPGVRQ